MNYIIFLYIKSAYKLLSGEHICVVKQLNLKILLCLEKRAEKMENCRESQYTL